MWRYNKFQSYYANCFAKCMFSFINIRIVYFLIAHKSAELERYGYHFVDLVVPLLHSYKVTNHPRLIIIFIILHFPNLLITGLLICQEKLASSVTQIRILVENLRFRPGYGVMPL